MKPIAPALLGFACLLAAASPGFADPAAAITDGKSICVATQRGYDAHVLGHREIWVRNSLGSNRPELKLTTSCFDLQPTMGLSVSSISPCIERGDKVTATDLNGHVKQRRVIDVTPYSSTPDKDAPRG